MALGLPTVLLRRTLVPRNPEQLTKTAYVSTNSIAQGEQVGILWNELFNKYKIKIHFAHRTFSWKNEARGNAAVHVVIIGFGNFDVYTKVSSERRKYIPIGYIDNNVLSSDLLFIIKVQAFINLEFLHLQFA